MIKQFLIFICIFFVFFCTSPFLQTAEQTSSESKPWFTPFTPLRTFYVTPTGNDDGKTIAKPMSFQKALSSGLPGDLYWILAGTYKGAFQATREGTEKDPIVFRAAQDQHVLIEGGIDLRASYNWLWGFEISDPSGIQNEGGAELIAPGIRVINNVIHHQLGGIGIGAWQQGKGQVIYGNIVYSQIPKDNNPHNLYVQNDYDSWGYKYIVNNIILDSADVKASTFNVHCYSEGGLITGLWFEKNIIGNGKFLIGGFNEPAHHDVVKENYFYKSAIQFGYRRPIQVRFQDNYVARSPIITEWFWGAGETQFKQKDPSVYTGNEILNPPGPHVRFSTSAYLPSGRCEGCSRIRSEDVFDQNKYSSPFRATFYADSNNSGMVDLETWRRITAQAGKAFDTNSVEVPPPAGMKVAILKNDYDPSRAHIAVYNWSGTPRVKIDLGTYLSAGTNFSIYDAKRAFQTAVLSGAYSGPIEIPCDREFCVFLITRK